MPDQHTRVLLGGYRTAEHTLTNGGESSPALGRGDQLRAGCVTVGKCVGDGNGSLKFEGWPLAPSPLVGEGWGEGENRWPEDTQKEVRCR